MEQEKKVQAIDSIVKIIDDKTETSRYYRGFFLYDLQLLCIEHVSGNLYNFRFLADTLSYMNKLYLYFNLQILINDDSIIKNSKYFIDRCKRFIDIIEKQYPIDSNNTFRVDFSIDDSDDKYYKEMGMVNVRENKLEYIKINNEAFFKINIFLYKLLTYGSIEADIFTMDLFVNHKQVFDNEIRNILADPNRDKFIFFWGNKYIISYLTDYNEFGIRKVKILSFITMDEKEYLKLVENNYA